MLGEGGPERHVCQGKIEKPKQAWEEVSNHLNDPQHKPIDRSTS